MNRDTSRKYLFYTAAGIAFLAILLMNFLTPTMSDDYFYGAVARDAGNLWGILVSEYENYMGHTGRNVAHFILKCFLSGDKWVFNLCNSLNFIGLSLLIYANIEKRKKYDVTVFVLIQMLLWIFGIRFGETILWETGSCNYLWGTTNILGAVTLVRFALKNGEKLKNPYLWGILLFFAGIIGGWCNENTSGGGILLMFLLIGSAWYKKQKIRPWVYAGPAGMMIGFIIMFLSPGNWVRASFTEDNYGGIVKYIARFYKVTLSVEENLFALLLLLLLLVILAKAQKCEWKELESTGIYFVAAIATCYALILVPTPVARAYFGAGIFLTVACVQCFVLITEKEAAIRALKQSFVYGMLLYMGFTYVDSVVNVARICRDYERRDAYIWEQKAAGKTEIVVPLIQEGFETKYSFGYDTDFGVDSGYWVNEMAEKYYEVDSIRAVPLDEWTEY